MNRLSLKTILEKLDIKDTRTARSWCSRHGVECIRDGKSYFVMEADFLLALSNVGFKKSPTLATPKINTAKFEPSAETKDELNKCFARIAAKAIRKEQSNRSVHILQRM